MSKNHQGLLVLLTLALGARLALFAGILTANPDGFFDVDSRGYWALAENLLERGIFSQGTAPPYLPDATRTPVYPLFLAGLRGVGFGPVGVALVQILLSSAIVVGVVVFTRRWVGRLDAALIAGALVALDVPAISAANSVLTETLFTGLLLAATGAFLVALKSPRPLRAGALAGVLLGAAALCRPAALYLPPIWAALFVIARGRSGAAPASVAVFALAVALVVGPWALRNQRTFGSAGLTTIGYQDLYEFKAAAVVAQVRGQPLHRVQADLRREAAARFDGDPLLEPVRFERSKAPLALAIFLAHPVETLRSQVATMVGLLVRPLRSTLDLQLGYARFGTSLVSWGGSPDASLLDRLLRSTSGLTLSLVALQIALLAVLWLGVAVGAGELLRRGRRAELALVAVTVLYFAAVHAGAAAFARYRVPLVPLLALLAGPGLAVLRDRLGRLRTRGDPGSSGLRRQLR